MSVPTSFPPRSSTDDGSNPYFLSNSDNPSTILVAPVLDGLNYYSWRRSMEIALGAKSKMCFVDGSLTPPSPTDPDYPHWSRCNLMIQAWIINSCNKDIAQCIIYSPTAAAMWKTLAERYAQVSGMNCKGDEEGPKLELKLNLSPSRDHRQIMSRGRVWCSSEENSPRISCVSREVSPDDRTVRSYSSSPGSRSMMLVGCPRCLMYVMLMGEDPRCPKCKSTVLLDVLHQETERRLNN